MDDVIGETDTFGRVSNVRGVAIVTVFWTLKGFPLDARKSFYEWNSAKINANDIRVTSAINHLAEGRLPLTSVDRTSVKIALIRAVCSLLILFGFIVTFVGLLVTNDPKPPDAFARNLLLIMQLMLLIGLSVGLLTYLVPTISKRDRLIREYCGEVLGICIDPARISARIASEIRDSFLNWDATNNDASNAEYIGCLLQLTLLRCDAQSQSSVQPERTTNELLDRLKQLSQ